MKDVVLSRVAQGHLRSIRSYIARENADAAAGLLAKIERAIQLISDNPGIGRVRADIQPYCPQVWPVEEYLIFYQVRQSEIIISAVLHGARDLPTYFQSH